jgi:hypothetical protein
MTPQLTKEQRQRFLDATASLSFNTIDQVVHQLEEHGYFDETFQTTAIEDHKKIVARKIMRSLRDNRGRPAFHSIMVRDGEKEERRYKQEALFDPEDFAQTVNYHVGMARHHAAEAIDLANEAARRYGIAIQLEFGFPGAERKRSAS